MPEPDQAMILGEIRGQLREVVHGQNNLSAKVDGLAREVIGLGAMAAQIGKLEASVQMLMDERSQRQGATGIINTILRSPTLGWLTGAGVSAWAILTGKVHL